MSNFGNALSDKAPLINPQFQGIPTAPTATMGTNTTQIATTAFVQTAVKPKIGIITLTTSSWSNLDPYSQTVTISNYAATANTKVDLCFDPTVYAQMLADGCSTIYIVNNNGTLTAYAQGAKPTANLSVQCRVEEVTTL